jgi:hypothetical protein
MEEFGEKVALGRTGEKGGGVGRSGGGGVVKRNRHSTELATSRKKMERRHLQGSRTHPCPRFRTARLLKE